MFSFRLVIKKKNVIQLNVKEYI